MAYTANDLQNASNLTQEENMGNQDAKTVVLNYLKAFQQKDFKTARTLVHDDFSFHGPFRKFEGGDQFVEAITRMGPMLKAIHVNKIFADGEDVCVVYDFVTTNPAIGTTPTAELCKVVDGKIKSTLLIFDGRPYA
jgi:predicted SnoaL-like aldol condensation-catalyzing enzyme